VEDARLEEVEDMTLIGLLVMLVVVGVCLWLIETYVPMSPPIKTLIRVVVVLVLVVWLLSFFGLLGPSMPRLH